MKYVGISSCHYFIKNDGLLCAAIDEAAHFDTIDEVFEHCRATAWEPYALEVTSRETFRPDSN